MKIKQATFYVCLIALLGMMMLPASAKVQTVADKAGKAQTTTQPATLPIKGKIGWQEYGNKFLELMARQDTLTGEELLLYKQLADELGAEYERLYGTADLPLGVMATGADTCGAATTNTTTFTDSDTTVGAADDYDPATATTCPTTGGGVSGGTMFTGTGAGPDKVYKLNSPTAGTAIVSMDPTTTADLALYVLSPTCPPGMFTTNCIVGDDSGGGGTAEMVTFPIAAGTDYFIVVDGFAGASGPYDLVATVAVPPANDSCTSATVINPALNPQTITQSTTLATTAPTDPLIPCAFGGPFQHSNTVWFSYTAPVTQDVTVTTNGSSYGGGNDTVLAVWCPPCPTPTELVACDDDSGAGFLSAVTFRAAAGQTYLIEVADWGAPNGGTLNLNISSVNVPAPPNDACAAATPVTFGANGGVFMVCQSTDGATELCGEPGIGGASVWYQVTAGKTGFLDLGTFGVQGLQSTNYDTTIHVRTACPPGGVALADNDDFGNDLRSRVIIAVTAGQTFRVRIGGFNNATGTLCVRFVNF